MSLKPKNKIVYENENINNNNKTHNELDLKN